MIRCLISIALLLLLTSAANGTMWLYDDPTFFQLGYPFYASISDANVSIFEALENPNFPLLGQGFYTEAIPVEINNKKDMIEIRSIGRLETTPSLITFGEHSEKNLKYAQIRSSLRVGKDGVWSNLNSPSIL